MSKKVKCNKCKQDLEDKLQGKRQALEKWGEMKNWSQGALEHLEHIKYQLESNQPLETVEGEVEKLSAEVETWENTARGVDLLCQQSATEVTGQSARSIVHQVSSKVEQLR